MADLSVLLEYSVVDKYLYVIKDKRHYESNPFLLKACSAFFKRIVHQVKQTWIFFQLETLSIFNNFLQADQVNNKLMRNVNMTGASSKQNAQLNYNTAELKSILKAIVLKFVQLLKRNKMLAVEILFEFPSREIKDQILNNYEHGEGGPRPAEDKAERVDLAE